MPALIEPVVPAGALRRLGGQPTLHVDELTLRPWRHEDAPAVVAAYHDPDIQRWHARTVEAGGAVVGRVAEKAGFPFEATERSAVLHPDGRWHDMHVHARIAA